MLELRGQAELISTVIIVSVAIIIAFGLIYYFNPMISRSSAEYQLSSKLSLVASSLVISPISSLNKTDNVITVLFVKNMGQVSYRLYTGVVVLYGNIPVKDQANISIFIMRGDAAVVDGNEGWKKINGFNTTSQYVYIYINSKYYRLSDYVGQVNYTLFDLGVLGNSRSSIVLKNVLRDPNPIYTYVLSFLVRVGDKYYEVGRFPIYSGASR
ncbi:hypothetical protein PYJP_02120 [Pyrofollis japonicus]|uniref:hypothetical protein n=1 Tax=Pyrofollis japonicus TaxID=3060460 RepID=UPI00295C0F2F|nr:hypothetical protein [Pyrofollis japonicus]BEP16860.1 hypothetical protein PYJP_02120 [Pyrofollis japonicus]